MILTLETQESADSGSMGSSGGGTRAGYCTKESVPRSIKTTPPKLQEILLPVQMFEFERPPPTTLHPPPQFLCHTHRTELRSR